MENADLMAATRPFTTEDRARTWRETLISWVIWGLFTGMAMLGPIWLAPIAVFFAGLSTVRLFIIYHDALHGAVFRRSWAGQRMMDVIGLMTLAPRSIWTESHDYHHRNNCKLPSTAIGSYPLVTTRMWRRMSKSDRNRYSFARHPLNMVFAYVTLFIFGMCIFPFMRAPKKHWDSLLALVLHIAAIAVVTLTLGFTSALFGIILPLAFACTVGAYLFYAQHNAPGVYVPRRPEWNHNIAAMKCSTFFEMPGWMHFFTANIGYHHIHHLNHRIPFYNLPEAMEKVEGFKAPVRTSWRPSDVRAALALKLWDPSQKELVAFPEA